MKDALIFTKARKAIQSGNLDLVKKLITDSSVVNRPGKGRRTLLHEAASSDQFADIARYLISVGAMVDSKTPEGITPFYVACENGCESIARILIDAGCNINAPVVDFTSDKNCMNFTPLHIACYQENLPIIKLLLENDVNVNAKHRRGCTPTHIAVDKSNSMVVRMLIKAGANLNLRDSQGYTALHNACILGNLEMFNMLLEHLGYDESIIDQQTPNGWTLLMLACKFKHYAIAERLIECKANTALINCDGLLTLHIAAQGELKLFKLVLLNTPKEAIDQYCSFKRGLKHYRSLPCIIIDSKAFDSLKLLYESGVSEAVLKCPKIAGGRLLSPIDYLLLLNTNSWSVNTNSWSDNEKLKFLEFLLSYKFLINPVYGDCPHEINIIEAAVEMHSVHHRNMLSPYNVKCHCEAFLSLILSKVSSPCEVLPRTQSTQLSLFYKAAKRGYVAALNLLKYVELIEPDDVLEDYLGDIKRPAFPWNGRDFIVEFLMEKCTTDIMSKVLEQKKSLSRIYSLDLDEHYAFESILNSMKSTMRVASLKRICRFVVRRQIRKEIEASSLSFRSYLQNMSLPSYLSKYLLYEIDF